MSEDNQIVVPPSFVALFVPPGRIRPTETREAITARYEFCEALATMLVERAQTLQWQLGITEADVLARIREGLTGPDAPVPADEGDWVLSRLAELLEWERPAWKKD
ncbi:MAG: ATPase with chaperone activity [Burkholderiaceae bacterium]